MEIAKTTKTCSAFPYFLSGMYYRPGHDVKLATSNLRPPGRVGSLYEG